MSKTPYEVRLDILKMAQDMLERETSLEETKFYSIVNNMNEVNIGGVEGFVKEHAPKMYTPEEVISKAEALYSFVNDTTSVRRNKDK